MVKALQKETGKPKGKVGKIEASALNKKEGRDGKQNHLEAGSSSLADCLFLWALMELLMQPSAKTATIASIT